MLRPLPRAVNPEVLARTRALPLLDRCFDALEIALARLGIDDASELKNTSEVEAEVSEGALPQGTLVIFDEEEVHEACRDIRDTVMDERLGGAVFGTMLRSPAECVRRARLREMTGSAIVYGFLPVGQGPAGLGRVLQVRRPAALADYDFLVADIPGFHVALVTRKRPGGGSITLWTGTRELVDEILGSLRRAIADDGHAVPAPAPLVPARDVVRNEAEVWAMAEQLRKQRVVREAELRQVARQAALRGVELRRERDKRASA